MKIHVGMKALAAMVGLMIGSYSGNARAANYCTYGGSPQGAVRFEFAKRETGTTFKRYHHEARLSPSLFVKVTMTPGHSARFQMTASYNNGLVTMEDSYVDFQPLENLYLSGSVEGKRLFCQFNPAEFGSGVSAPSEDPLPLPTPRPPICQCPMHHPCCHNPQ